MHSEKFHPGEISLSDSLLQVRLDGKAATIEGRSGHSLILALGNIGKTPT